MNSNTRHIVLDLETLGKDFNAPIIQIGAVKWTEGTPYDKLELFDYPINMDYLNNHVAESNFKIGMSTLNWWMLQTDEVRNIVFRGNKDDFKIDNKLDYALSNLFNFIFGFEIDYSDNLKNENVKIWQMSNFDAPILLNSFNYVFGKDNILHTAYRKWTDYRTIRELFTERLDFDREPFIGVQHNALDDAKHEMKFVQKFVDFYNSKII